MDSRTSTAASNRELSHCHHIQNGSGLYLMCKVASFPGDNRWKRDNDNPYPRKRTKCPTIAARKHRDKANAKTRDLKEVREALVMILVATPCRLVNTYQLPMFRRDVAISIAMLLCSALCCYVQHYVVMFSTMLLCSALCCYVQHYVVMFSTMFPLFKQRQLTSPFWWGRGFASWVIGVLVSSSNVETLNAFLTSEDETTTLPRNVGHMLQWGGATLQENGAENARLQMLLKINFEFPWLPYPTANVWRNKQNVWN